MTIVRHQRGQIFGWKSTQTILGLQFDTVANMVSMPNSKIPKARQIVASTFHATTLTRKEYRSLFGSLRQMASCIRSARLVAAAPSTSRSSAPLLPASRSFRLNETGLGLVVAHTTFERPKRWIILVLPRPSAPRRRVETYASDCGL